MANNSFDIYQLKNNETTRDLRFERMEFLKKKGIAVDKENYDLIYHAPLDKKDTLDSIYERFNLYHPADFRGHSLSVSDVVVFHKDGVDTAYYVDSYGFTEVPEFLQVQIKEQLTNKNDREPTVEEIAKIMDLPKETVVLALEAIVEPVSLYEPVFSDGNDTIYVMDQIGDNNDDSTWLEEIAVKEAISNLSDREKRILSLRFFRGKTQMEVANEIGISQAQVSRIEKGALDSIKKNI